MQGSMSFSPSEPPALGPDSRRLHERVRQYWDSMREGRRYPAEQEIDPMAIPEAWDWCFLVNMRKGSVANGFTYEYLGPELMGAYGTNMVSFGQCDASTAPHIASMLRHFDEVTESGEAAIDESMFENIHMERIKYRCCLLPLGRQQVEYILGCMRWKSF